MANERAKSGRKVPSRPFPSVEGRMEFKRLDKVEQLAEFVRAASLDRTTLDLETTGLDPFKDKILHGVIKRSQDPTVYMFPAEFVPALSALTGAKILHNFRFDYRFLYQAGVKLNGNVCDTMLLHHLSDENASHGLDSIVQARYQDKYKEEFWAKYKTYEEASPDDQLTYACKDVWYTEKLFQDLHDELWAQELWGKNMLSGHVHKLAWELYQTERDGIAVDLDYLGEIGGKLEIRIHELKHEMRKMCALACEAVELDHYATELNKRKTDKGKDNVPYPVMNFDSNKQLQELLYRKLGLKVQKNFFTKQPTTDDAALTALTHAHPVVPLIQEYRGNQKVFTAFIEGTLDKHHNSRIYPSFNVNGTVTGRISSSNPNMQQLPRDGGVRGMYVPDRGYKFISCDYSQLEIVIAAHLSADPTLCELIRTGKSMHDHTAALCKIERQQAKMVNFLTIYGGQEFTLAQRLGVSIERAGQILDDLWLGYEGLKAAIDADHKRVEDGEPIINLYGRRRRFPVGLAGSELKRAKRQAFNARVQGTGADITHEAFYTAAQEMRKNGWGKALFEVHDEILLMPKEEYCKEAAVMLQSVMVNVGVKRGLIVPLSVDCSEPLDRWVK